MHTKAYFEHQACVLAEYGSFWDLGRVLALRSFGQKVERQRLEDFVLTFPKLLALRGVSRGMPEQPVQIWCNVII